MNQPHDIPATATPQVAALRQQAEEAIRASEARYSSLIEAMEEGFALHEMIFDEQGKAADYRFLEVNPAFGRLTGLDTKTLVGRTVREVVPGIEPVWIERYGRVGRTGQSERFEDYVAGLDRWFGVFAYSPTPGKFAVAFSDITERKRTEEKLRSSEAFLNTILEQSPHTMWISNAHGTLVRTNQAMRDMFQVTDEEVVGKYNLLQDEIVQDQGFIPQVRDVFEKGRSVQFCIAYDTSRLKHVKLGNTRHLYLDVTISPIFGANGEVINAVIQHLDITERKRAEEALRKSHDELARFNGFMVGRELRMIELKREINAMCGLAGEPPRYTVDHFALTRPEAAGMEASLQLIHAAPGAAAGK